MKLLLFKVFVECVNKEEYGDIQEVFTSVKDIKGFRLLFIFVLVFMLSTIILTTHTEGRSPPHFCAVWPQEGNSVTMLFVDYSSALTLSLPQHSPPSWGTWV